MYIHKKKATVYITIERFTYFMISNNNNNNNNDFYNIMIYYGTFILLPLSDNDCRTYYLYPY